MAKNCILFLVLLLSGCATGRIGYVATVDSINDPALMQKKSYILLPGNENIKPEDLQFREYSTYINAALAENGYKRVENPDEAELIIFAYYGISDPKTFSYTYSYPIFGKTAGGNTAISLTTYGKSGFTNTFGNVTSPVEFGVVGSNIHTKYETIYYRYLILDAVDYETYRKTEKFVSVWKTIIRSSGNSGDLRLIFPVLATAARRNLGSNTGRQIDVTIEEGDADLAKIRHANIRPILQSTGTSGGKKVDECDYYQCMVYLSPEEQVRSVAELINAKNDGKISTLAKHAKKRVRSCRPDLSPATYFSPETILLGNEAELIEHLCKTGIIRD